MRMRVLAPAVLLIVGIAGALRFLNDVQPVNAVGLFACGALFGVSCVRLLMAARRR